MIMGSRRWATVLVALAVGAGCTDGAGQTGEGRTEFSRQACQEFRSAARDAVDGVLTPTELRERLQRVDKEAEVASPAVRAAARDLLRAVTVGPGIGDADIEITALGDACRAAGY